ncbi:hypothetical protein [Micromonospora sp. NPDC049891]|uniref:hypothetical protein n=1 Tax=Micromonospora sp. NPDC049891 TaxID=3155655 RepID=UPI0033EAF56A
MTTLSPAVARAVRSLLAFGPMWRDQAAGLLSAYVNRWELTAADVALILDAYPVRPAVDQ